MSNKRAEDWLRSLGFACQEEPEWITEGQKPDYFCEGPINLWAEVKTLGHEERFERLVTAHNELRKRAKGIQAYAQAMVWVRTPLDSLDAKKVMALVARELSKGERLLDKEKLIVMVPAQPDYDRHIRFSFETDDGKKAVISSVTSLSGKYGWPGYLTPYAYSQDIEMVFSDGRVEKKTLREITSFDDNVRVAVELNASDNRFDFIGTAPVGAAHKLHTGQRIREAINDANSQGKNGCRYREAPSLTVIFHDDLLVAENEMVLAPLYGDLAYTFPARDFQSGRWVLTRNGIFQPDKNRTTSAVCYIRNNSKPLIVHNLWATRPLAVAHLRGQHIVPKGDGTFSMSEV